jgi:putative membrane protein
MRVGDPLPHSPIPRLVAAALTLTAVIAVVLTVVDQVQS